MNTIVIVEDDQDTQEIYLEILTKEHFHVFPASNGRIGLKLIQSENPNLVILDLMLPGEITGMKLLKMLHNDARFSSLPVLVITNLKEQKSVAKSLGATDVIVKPDMSLETLISSVKKYAT